jgi:ribA/ribD-fused uncharacterized protein
MPSLPLDRTALIDAVARGERFQYRFFWGHTPRADGRIDTPCLSQWWRCRFELDRITYNSAEQWMMAEKARLFGDAEVLAQILAADDPHAIKMLGRAVRGFDPERWSAECFERVVRGNVAKFGQDAALGAFLRSTAGEILVEAAPRDTIWGIGLSATNEKAKDPRTWRGKNLLGFALTQTRSILESQPEGSLRVSSGSSDRFR